MTPIRLALAIFLLTGLAAANSRYERIDTADFMNRAEAYQGRLVLVRGDICAVNADRKSIRLFDTQTRALIDVQLTQLKKVQRSALMLNPVLHVSVYGRVEPRNGRLIIDAHQVVAIR